ncbi:MAG TPA: hypothetical protein DHV68_06290 [Dehalococcoidia bacterium]|nr:hypothetical protein [Chloroflexota bacterium]HCI86437.1 hypothetical protein [Dehalococcoidia bacterium]|tara:strand:- start:2893 stop:3141 length:249 start_codon:yes stop_codon:yes gene_type:complete
MLIAASLSSLPTGNALAKAASQQALLLRELYRDERVTARKRRETLEDIRKILTDIVIARASAEDELEVPRLLTETSQIKAFF